MTMDLTESTMQRVRDRLARYGQAYAGCQIPVWLQDYLRDATFLLALVEELRYPPMVLEYKPPSPEQVEEIRRAAEAYDRRVNVFVPMFSTASQQPNDLAQQMAAGPPNPHLKPEVW